MAACLAPETPTEAPSAGCVGAAPSNMGLGTNMAAWSYYGGGARPVATSCAGKQRAWLVLRLATVCGEWKLLIASSYSATFAL